METGAGRLLYQHAGALLVRASTHVADLDGLGWPDLPSDTDRVEQWCSWLARVWGRDDVGAAVEVASPVLARQMREIRAGHRPPAGQVRRIVISMVSYLLRWKGRATPFGLFAGVALARIGAGPVVRWNGEARRVVARADADWLAQVIGRLERHPGLLERLPVMVNTATFVRGDRLVVPGQPQDGVPGEIAPLEVSVRATRPARAAVEAARAPTRCGDLVKQLAADYPTTPTTRIPGMLSDLVARRVLLSSLWPPMTVTDALGHVLAQLAAAGGDEVPEVAPLVWELREIQSQLARHNRGMSPAAGRQARATAAEQMSAVSDAAPQPLAVDVAVGCEAVLPESVAGEAATAAAVLLQLTPYPFGQPEWKAFHARFLERYGVGAVVPVRELVQVDTGLGMPAGYLGSPYKPAARALTDRDEALLALAQHAVMDDNPQIVLTESTIRALAVGDPAEMLVPPRAELAFQIHAASPAALARGAFRLVVTGVPRTASSMIGRFAGLLDAAGRDRLARDCAAQPTADPDALLAQLSFPPHQRRSENVTRVPQLLPHVISLSEHRAPSGGLIPVDDLAVGGDARRLHLVSLSTGRRVEPVVLHALEARVQTPPLARFLAEVTTARCAVYGPFDWGAAAGLPYLPRLSYGRSVLCPARWLLSARDLPARSAPTPEWEAALEAWRRRFRVPAAVVLSETDLRLPLDLDDRLHRALLRSRIDRSDKPVELREGPTSADHAWCGRTHELVIPLRLARPCEAAPPRQPRSHGPPRPVARDAGHLPGRGTWLYARIHGNPARQDEILTEHLPRLHTAGANPLVWWFRRYRDLTRPDADQHLRLYIRLPSPGHYGPAAARFGDWAADMRGLGLVPQVELGTYHPETGRYGFGAAMAAAEEAFAADSAAAVAQITMAARAGIPVDAITVAGLVDLATSYTGTLHDGMRWLIGHLPHEPATVSRALRAAVMRLAGPHNRAALRAEAGGESVLLAWDRRRAALTAYREKLEPEGDPLHVLRSLLHMHHVRAIGVDPERERVGRRLARAAALRWAAEIARQGNAR
jgi:thiopeptide-type bacteriocin biosynthesis protein